MRLQNLDLGWACSVSISAPSIMVKIVFNRLWGSSFFISIELKLNNT